MKTKANELCFSCRNLQTPGGRQLGDLIDIMHANPDKFQNMSDRDFNAAILSVLHAYPNQHCSSCYGLVLGRAR